MSTAKAKQRKGNVVQLQYAKPLRRKINVRTPQGKINKHWVAVDHGGKDPKKDLLAKIGKLPAEIVQLTRILVAIYRVPMVTKTAGGIIFTDHMSEEDHDELLWQGKVEFIVAMGSQAYVDDETYKFHGVRCNVGDWVWFRASDGQGCDVNEVFCRVLRERDIVGKLDHPDQVW